MFALLNTTGKTPEQIVLDLPAAVRKFDEFVKAKQGGMYGYQPNMNKQNTTNNQLDDVTAYQEYLKTIGQ